jgi:hypothetical protein
LALGLTSYSRLADLAVHNAYYARAIGRVRAFYLTIEPAAHPYWLQPAGDDAHAVMRQAGQPHSRWHHLGHTATSVAAVVAVIAGALVGVVGSVVTPLSAPVIAAGSAVLAVAAFGGLLADQERRWRRSDGSLQSHFLPDGTPSVTATAFSDDSASGRGCASFPALVDAATERQVGLAPVAEAR